jgi:hypothetical protein
MDYSTSPTGYELSLSDFEEASKQITEHQNLCESYQINDETFELTFQEDLKDYLTEYFKMRNLIKCVKRDILDLETLPKILKLSQTGIQGHPNMQRELYNFFTDPSLLYQFLGHL